MSFYKFARALLSIIFRIIYRIEVIGIENIPEKGRAILCSNHISMLDPIILGISIKRPISFMAKKELFKNPFIAKLLTALAAFPVDRENSDLTAIRNSINVLKMEKILGMFPEGTRTKKMDLEFAKPGVSLIAYKGKSPVIPVFIETDYRLFSKISINIGKPIIIDDLFENKPKTEDHKKISKYILKSIYSLKNNRGK
ncbi:MAG: 1-acyl-sn-glycerol-3-phosphate acyltransferase [Tissierellia bacterium]|nr:1-acyl-sn-glycerol-3-phosphate acyltransferase [Tissierellia bacterium]